MNANERRLRTRAKCQHPGFTGLRRRHRTRLALSGSTSGWRFHASEIKAASAMEENGRFRMAHDHAIQRRGISMYNRYLRYTFDVLLSVYCAGAIVVREDMRDTSKLLDAVWTLLVRFDRAVGPHLSLGGTRLRWVLVTWCLLAGLFFVALRLVRRIHPLGRFVFLAGGGAALAGPLLCRHLLLTPTNASMPSSLWLWLEGITMASVFLCFADIRPPLLLALLGITAHFGFWALTLFGGIPGYWRDNLFWIAGMVLLPFCASIVWWLCATTVLEDDKEGGEPTRQAPV